jgi:hypothetical protein
MAVLRYNNQAGLIGFTLNTSTGSQAITGLFGVAPSFATITGTDYIKLVLDAGTSSFEVVYLTAYISGSLNGTITRAQEGTSAVAHTSGSSTWANSHTANDFMLPGQQIGQLQITASGGLDSYHCTTTLTAVAFTGGFASGNPTLSFLVPWNGNVNVEVECGYHLSAMNGAGGTGNYNTIDVGLLNHSGGAQLGLTQNLIGINALIDGADQQSRLTRKFILTGLSVGTVMSVDLAADVLSVAGSDFGYIELHSGTGSTYHTGDLLMFAYVGF